MGKLKKTITDSSQAKIGGKMLRKRENKNYHSVSFIPDGEEKIPKKYQKIQKLEKYHYGFIQSQNMLEKAEKVRKYKLSFCFVPSRWVRENSKK